MASINGISIKSLKMFHGHEGEELFQGNVYKDGKKLGFWSQDFSGGVCDNFDFDETPVAEAAEAYKNFSGKVEKDTKEYFDASFFMSELAELTDIEKEFKKWKKKGYPSIIIVKGGGFTWTQSTTMPASTKEEKEAVFEKFGKKFVEEFKAKTPKWAHTDIKTEVFGQDDFTLRYDAA